MGNTRSRSARFAVSESPVCYCKQVSSHTLMEAFGRFGKIASAVVMYDQEGVSRGFGFVNYVEDRAAQLAIDHYSKLPRTPGNAWQARIPALRHACST